ncbi:hypothetical protein SAMN04488040_2343 [Sulfitobacter marinus]|uniref:Uncharacterized protein n=1 Tax=Sulfitobacter marinus TaxID=394264 RepID=A0A1I6TMG5_9RHOB|nr:hypothetical protein [Sulfitobacter marinus]SFS90320.1 hypothetical protein SAMN04488040_2343 [Sulfitobacter marinus]
MPILAYDCERLELLTAARMIWGSDPLGLRTLVLELHPNVISRAAMKRISEACVTPNLYPRVELSTRQVIAFKRIGA